MNVNLYPRLPRRKLSMKIRIEERKIMCFVEEVKQSDIAPAQSIRAVDNIPTHKHFERMICKIKIITY